MLRLISRNEQKDRVQNNEVHLKIGVPPFDERWGRVTWND